MKFCPYCGKEINGNHCDCEEYKINILAELEIEESPQKEEVDIIKGEATEEVNEEFTEPVKETFKEPVDKIITEEGDKFNINKVSNFLVDALTHPFTGIKKINNIGLINSLIVMALLSIVSGVGIVLCVKNLASSVLSSMFEYSFYGMSMDLTSTISLKGLYITIPIITFVLLVALAALVYGLPIIFKKSNLEFEDALSIVAYPFILPTVIGALVLIISILSGHLATMLLVLNSYITIYLLYGSISNNIEIGRSKLLYIFALICAIFLCIYGAVFYKQILSVIQNAVNNGINSFFDGLF